MQSANFELVRQRFHRACGYCGVSETSSGGLLTIDHYHPRSRDGSDDLDNLVYACYKCNQYKHEFWPSAEQLARQHRVLHPLFDDFSVHFRLNEQSGVLDPITATGYFHITLLQLNRPQLVKHRLSQQMVLALQERNMQLERQLAEIQQTMMLRENYISVLLAQIEQLRKPSQR
jgi:hypothetical protein